MAKLPKDIKLTRHAKLRLKERKNANNYNTKNLMRSSCKWYGKDDLIPNSALYLHCLYVCRKSKQIGYITDGNIEVIYNKGTGVAITIMEVKEKFLPITQYIKPEYLEQIKIKKEKKKMEKLETNTKSTKSNVCPDCGEENVKITLMGICDRCRSRKFNAEHRGKTYIPYINLSEKEKIKIDHMRMASAKAHKERKEKQQQQNLEVIKDIPMPNLSVAENYYEIKAMHNNSETESVTKEIPSVHKSSHVVILDSSSDQMKFIDILKECNPDILESNEELKEVLNILITTDKIKDTFMMALKNKNKNIILNLKHILNISEKKLQSNWENNGFQEIDDLKFKEFLTWKKILKESISFWDKLYSIDIISEMKKIVSMNLDDVDILKSEPKKSITQEEKKFKVTTDSISIIFNTKRPFTRVFYAKSKEEAYEKFLEWMSKNQLREDKDKTKIVELS